MDPADRQAPDVQRRVEVGDERLEGMIGFVGRGRNVLLDCLEQRREVGPFHIRVGAGPAGAGIGVEDREADLVLVGV